MAAQQADSAGSTAGNAYANSHRWIDMPTLMRIRNLQLRAKSVVDGFHNGLHRSPLHGFSVEFSEYRPYSEGDDPRNIDWKLYARSDRYYIKKFEDETNRRCYIVVDKSRSMAFQSLDYSKYDYARTLAATLAYYLTLQRDPVGVILFSDDIDDMITARYRTGQLRRVLSSLEGPVSGQSTDLRKPLSHIADMVHHRSLVIIVSDFLVPTESLRTPLSLLRARRHEVLLLRVLDPAEVNPNFQKPVMLRDMETGQERFIDWQQAKSSYDSRFSAHAEELRSLAGQFGMGWLSLTTDESVEKALLDYLIRQQRAVTRAHRASTNRGASQGVKP